MAQCVEYYYSWKKEHKLASTLAQVSGKKIKTCREGQGTGKRGQKPAGELCETPLCQEHVVPRPGEGAADAAQGFIVLLLRKTEFQSVTLTQQSSTATKMGFDSVRTWFSSAGTLAGSNQILSSLLLANINNPDCVDGDAADFQGSFAASQCTPQKGAASAVALLKLSFPANRNLVHRERLFWVVETG